MVKRRETSIPSPESFQLLNHALPALHIHRHRGWAPPVISLNTIAASLSFQMMHIYSLNYLTAGFSYLPSGLGGALAAYSTGKLLDRDYRTTSKHHPPPANVSDFPIERARLRSVFLFIAINTLATAGL